MRRWLILLGVLAALLPGAALASSHSGPAGVAVDGDGVVYVTDYQNDRVLKLSADGLLLQQWGVRGSGPGQFSNPFGVALDRENGTTGVYVVDQANSRVQRFTADGTFVASWGRSGSNADQLRTPFGAAAVGGTLYVADFGNDRVQVFASDGTLVRSIGRRGTDVGQFSRPAAVALDRDGNVYVADHFNDRVQKFAADGTFLAQFGGGTGSFASGPGAFMTNGASSEGLLSRPEGLALDRDGNLYVADYGRHRVVKLSPEGRLLAAWGEHGTSPGQFDGPKGVALDSMGRVYVADAGNGRIQRFSADGVFELAFSLP